MNFEATQVETVFRKIRIRKIRRIPYTDTTRDKQKYLTTRPVQNIFLCQKCLTWKSKHNLCYIKDSAVFVGTQTSVIFSGSFLQSFMNCPFLASYLIYT